MPPEAEARFSGFAPDAFAWFDGLERDNSKEYFTATRDRYEAQVRGELEAMLEELTETFGGTVRMFRQQRDLRFTPDKSPYKTATYGIVYGARVPGTGLYAQLSARGLYAGTGYHQLGRDQLERFRSAVADAAAGPSLAEIVASVEAEGIDVEGESLRTAPRGYPRDHPRIELLRVKSLVAGRRLSGKGGIDRDAGLEHVSRTWRAAEPLNEWLDDHVGPSTIPVESRPARR